MKILQRIIFFVFIVYIIHLQAQTPNERGNPFIRNYANKEYNAATQNWAALQDHRGIMYFGNSNSVLEFDGKYWRKIAVTNHSMVRSLAIDKKGTIYVGAVSEFGYLANDSSGKLTYVSLSDQLNEKEKDFKNVWKTHATTHGIYFVTYEEIFRFYKGKIDIITVSIKNQSRLINDAVIFKKRDDGLYVLKDGQLQLLPHSENLAEESAGRHEILPFTHNKVLITTQNKGIFIYDCDMLIENGSFISDFSKRNVPPSVIKKFPTEIDEYLHHHQLYGSAKVSDHCYAFGTNFGGIVVMDHKGKLASVINKNRGLQDNNIRGIFVDRDHNLWAALNRGISHIELSSPLTCFDDTCGIEQTINYIIRHQGNIYVSTYGGIFYLPEYKLNIKNDWYGFLPVQDAKESSMQLISFKHILFAACRYGLKQIIDWKAKKTDIGGAIYCFGRSEKFPEHIFLGLRNGLAAMEVKLTGSNKPAKLKYIQGGSFKEVGNTIRKIVSDDKGDLWLTTYYDGIIYIRFNGTDISDFQIYRYNKIHGLPQMDLAYVYFVHNQLIIESRKGIYKAVFPSDFSSNPEVIKFVPEDTFGKMFHEKSIGVSPLAVDKENKIWVNSGIGMGILTQNHDGSYTWNSALFNKVEAESFYLEQDGFVWFTSDNKLFPYNPKVKKDYKSKYDALIRKVMIRDSVFFDGNYYLVNSKQLTMMDKSKGENHLREVFSISSLEQPDELKPVLKHRDNSMTFEYSAAFYEHADANQFQYMLEGFDSKWSDWSTETKKEYTNLPAGSYCFKVKAKNIFEYEGGVASFEFSISPPWYQTIYAYFGYGLMFLFIFFGGIRLNSRRLIAAKHRLEKIVKERTIELEEANLKLEKLAITDGLTGIANYRYFEESYNIEWKRTIRSGKPISVILADIDFFKFYNDTYGHQAGDETLKRVATVLDEIVHRAGDIVARYGGEEFVIVLPETNSEGANIIAEKIRMGVESLEIVHAESRISDYVTISVGCTTTLPKKEIDSATLIKAADEACYQSKQKGRNRVTVINSQSTI